MQIRGYSSWSDSIVGLPAFATRAEVESLSQNHLVVRVQEQDPNLRKVEDFLSGKVPERDTNIAELLNKMLF